MSLCVSGCPGSGAEGVGKRRVCRRVSEAPLQLKAGCCPRYRPLGSACGNTERQVQLRCSLLSRKLVPWRLREVLLPGSTLIFAPADFASCNRIFQENCKTNSRTCKSFRSLRLKPCKAQFQNTAACHRLPAEPTAKKTRLRATGCTTSKVPRSSECINCPFQAVPKPNQVQPAHIL